MSPDEKKPEEKKICADGKHKWKEVYYGTECEVCGLFYPDGCAPWDNVNDDDDWDEKCDIEAYDEPFGDEESDNEDEMDEDTQGC